jgi:hypothetical protein
VQVTGSFVRPGPCRGGILIGGKRGLDTFACVNLDSTLRIKGITTIALGGFQNAIT